MGFAVRDLALDRDLERDFDRARLLPATKAREFAFGLELPADRGCEAPVAAPELLRDRGGEDARVAMLGGYAIARAANGSHAVCSGDSHHRGDTFTRALPASPRPAVVAISDRSSRCRSLTESRLRSLP